MTRSDRCPGVLRPHRAEDGLMIRLRLPGGRTDAPTLAELGRLADRYGNPALQLTTRAGIQLRGLPDPLPAALVEALTDARLLPAASHERVRNIVCSPLTGLHGGRADLRPLVGELDREILRRPALADLSGRFLFALDDGRDDVTSSLFDLGYRALTADRGVLLVADHVGQPVEQSQAARRLADLAEDFLRRRPDPGVWHVRDLPAEASRPHPGLRSPSEPVETPLGRVGEAASVHVPLGLLTPGQLAAVTAVTHAEVIITPWRGLVVPGAGDRLDLLQGSDLVTDAGSPWALISACVGAPHCGSANGDTRAEARRLVGLGPVRSRTHVSGCARRCGAPAGPFRDVVLTGSTVS